MDLSGQGRIPSRFLNKIPAGSEQADPGPEENIIHFKPLFTWYVRPVPTAVPPLGPHAGVVFVLRASHATSHIAGVGHGAGSLLFPFSGPVLAGAASFIPDLAPALWVVVAAMISFMAVIWLLTHLICHRGITASRGSQKNSVERNKSNWVEDWTESKSENSTINRLSVLLMKTEAQSNRPRMSFEQYRAHHLLSVHNMNSNNTASMLSFPESVTPMSTKVSVDELNLSTHSLLINPSIFSPILESESSRLIYTVSEFKAPNTWQRRNMALLSHCKPSPFEECVEVFLLVRETVLVGKMKNLRGKKNEGEFVIQIWNTFDGSLASCIPKDADSYQSCDACCTAKDGFLMLVRLDKLVVWNVASNLLVSTTALPNYQTVRAAHSVQVTKNQSNIVILNFQPSTCTTVIYTGVLSQVISGSRELATRSISSKVNVYSVASDSCLLIGSATGEVIKWDFFTDLEILITYEDAKIQKILTSSSGNLLLIQSDQKVSIWEANRWIKMSEIALSADKICSMCLSTNSGPRGCLAIALDNGLIQIYDASSGSRTKQFTTYLPIVTMLFSTDGQTLIAMADRASLYQLFLFSIPQ